MTNVVRSPRVRSVAVVAMSCVLACAFAIIASMLPLSASAEEAAQATGYVTVTGAEGIDAAAQYASVSDASGAIAGVTALSEGASGISIVVHGSVAASSVSIVAPDGVAVGLIGSGEDAQMVASGTDAALITASGSLVVSNISFTGSVSLDASGNLSVDGCSFAGALSCTVRGSASISGNVFASSDAVPVAASAALAGAGSSLIFSGNTVSGYVEGLSVSRDESASGSTLSVSSNTFALVASNGSESDDSAVLRLAGGPWGPSSISFDGNAVESAATLIMLDSTFGIENPAYFSDGDTTVSPLLTIADGAVDAAGLAGIFELVGRGSGAASETAAGVSIDPALSLDGTLAAEMTSVLGIEPTVDAGASGAADEALLASSGDSAGSAYVVTFDANGASAGIAPDAMTSDQGSSVSVPASGTLVNAGYEFQGWNTAPDGSGTFYAVGQVFVPSGDVTLYAQWTPTGTVATIAVTSVGTAATTEGAA